MNTGGPAIARADVGKGRTLVSLRVVVAGAGIIGAATAYHLAREGAAVLLVGDFGGEDVVRAGFCGLGDLTETSPRYHRIRRTAIEEHLELGAGWWHHSAALFWRFDGTLRDRIAPLCRDGEDVRRMGRAEALVLAGSGVWIPPSVEEVAYAPNDGWPDASACVTTLLDRARRHGAVFAGRDAVTSFEQTGARWRARLASGRTESADVVVNATGSDAGRVAPRGIASVTTPVLVAEFRTPGFRLGRTIHTDRVSVRPSGDGGTLARSAAADLLLEGGYSLDDAVTELVRRVREVLPATSREPGMVVRVNQRAVRPALPATGVDPECPGYFEPFAPCSVLMGPLVGRAVAERITTHAECTSPGFVD